MSFVLWMALAYLTLIGFVALWFFLTDWTWERQTRRRLRVLDAQERQVRALEDLWAREPFARR